MRATPRPPALELAEVLRLADVMNVTGLRRSSIYERIAAGTFPRPIRISERAVGWLANEVAAWVHERIAQRDATPPRHRTERASTETSA